MPPTDWGWEITRDELESWILERSEQWLVVDKPGYVVCHPSKHGPWSSLVGACREFLGAKRVHIPCRLDRETSGVVVLSADRKVASRMQRAVQSRRVHKTYVTILQGELREPVDVDAPIGLHPTSEIRVRQAVTSDGQAAFTRFVPLETCAGYSLVRVEPKTGRLHQIRVHAAHIGHPVAGDKIYGPDEALFLEFIRDGFTGRLPAQLPISRQALHCESVTFLPAKLWPDGLSFSAPLADDMARFWRALRNKEPH